MTDADRGVIGGRYQIIASLGKGGMGQVYKAYDPVLDRTVALKKMIATVVDSEEGRQRFYIEARAAARLNHPNIVTIHELEEYGGDIYIVMELLDGVSLAGFMRQRVDMPLAGYLTIIAQIGEGLHYAHKRAIVHRDVKPPNLVLTTTGNLKILDFGIARLASSEITKKGKLLGTPHYMAPEQVMEQAVDARADLFSLGAVAYELVTGIKAFSADSIPALLMQITSTAHRPVLEVAPKTEPRLAAIIERLLAKDRTARFLTGMELVAALDLIGEIDRIDYVAEAVAAVMGPSGDATVYAPIGSTPIPTSAPPIQTPTLTPTPPSPPPPLFGVTPTVAPLVSVPPVAVPPISMTPAPPADAPNPWLSGVHGAHGAHGAQGAKDAQGAHGAHGAHGASDDATVSLSAPVRVPEIAQTPVSPASPVPPVPVPSAKEAPRAPVAAASVSPDAPTLVDIQAPTKPDVPPRRATLDTMIGAPPPLPKTAAAPPPERPATIAAVPPAPPLPVTGAAAASSVTPSNVTAGQSAPPGTLRPDVAAPVAGGPRPPIATPPVAAQSPTSASQRAAATPPAAPPSAAPSSTASPSAVPLSAVPPLAAPPSASAAVAAASAAAKTPAASAPRGFVNTGVPQARHRSGSGTAIVVVGLLLLPAVIATGWWAFNSVRGALRPGTTATDTTSPSAVKDAEPSTQKPAEPPAATTDQANQASQPNPADQAKPAETPSQEQSPQTPAVDANAATSTEKPPESEPPARPADSTQTAATQTPATQTQPNQAPGANQTPANQADANRPIEAREARNAQTPAREPSRDAVTDRTRETSPDTVVRDATRESTRTPGRDATVREAPRDTPSARTPPPPAESTRREPAPPVREEPPATEPAREPAPPSTPADTRSLDYGSLSAFRGGSRSTGSASSVYSDSPSTAAAVVRITYALEAYGDAIAARDLDALRDVRSPVTPAEIAMVKEGRLTVRFSNLDVSIDGSDARVRCRRAVVANGKTVSSGPSDVRLTRRPEGWVITDIR